MDVEKSTKDWAAFTFDATDSLRQLKFFRLLNAACWVGNAMTVVLFIQDMLTANHTTVNLHLFVLIFLGFIFGFGTFKCEQRIKFIRYQSSHFSNQDH